MPGNPSGVPAFCVPGLSSNCRAFDLRGRGWSDITAPRTYGWENHARDILEAADPRTLWPLLTVETLLLRATIPLGGGPDGFVVTRRDYDDFLATVKLAKGVEIAANHYDIVFAPEGCEEIQRFLGADGGE